MLSVILVDDEPNVRQGIKMMIPWKELGLNVIAEAESGDTGLKLILAYKPDIIITDVKMPVMSGIQMISEAKKRGFNGKFIILSGYSDFTYAKEAISLGVEEFILKPVDEDELIIALKNATQKIQTEKESAEVIEKSSNFYNEEIIKRVLLGENLEAVKAKELNFTFTSYTVAIISDIKDKSESHSSIQNAKKFICDFSNVDVVNIDIHGTISAIFKGFCRKDVIDTLKALQKFCDNKLFISIGNTVSDVKYINDSYKVAQELYKNSFLYLHLGIVYDEVITNDSTEIEEINGLSSQLFAYIEINDLEKLGACLESLQVNMRQKGYSQEKVKVICITIMLDIKSRIVKSIGEKKAQQFFNDEMSNEIGEKTSLYEIICLMKNSLTEVSNLIYGSTTKSTMERIVQYIRNNYNQELRLELLANIFGYNSAYLGKVFHQYTGENFNNYLDEIRITEAKRLLSKEEYKVYEVAEMVGYTNINYFHNKFKKYVGISPLNYKRKYNADYKGDE